MANNKPTPPSSSDAPPSSVEGSKEAYVADAQSVQTKAVLDRLPDDQLAEFIRHNPALDRLVRGQDDATTSADNPVDTSKNDAKSETTHSGSAQTDISSTKDMTNRDLAQALRQLSVQNVMAGLAASGRNAKDMGSYKFWKTQPVPSFDDRDVVEEEGPLLVQTVDDVSKKPIPLLTGFEWVDLDFTVEEELREVHDLLQNHYVEDVDSTLRFNYSLEMLRWAMMSPGWRKEWHVGVRASTSRKLVAFISAVPYPVRVRERRFVTSEVNFLVVHKKLRGKRLAPVLIKEITRRSNLREIWQGLYTGGNVLPKPLSTCRYYHRALNWQKLYEVGFSPLPPQSKPAYQVRKYALPDRPSLPGLREMRSSDVDAVKDLLERFLKRFDLAPDFSREEFVHWFPTSHPSPEKRFFWAYVVENANGKITDFFSFYCLESTVIGNPRHKSIRAAYLSYYASETALVEPLHRANYKSRLNVLMHDALIVAKQARFDVMNALTHLDNGLFLDQQKYGPGDGQLHYYLFNYRANPVAGGVDKLNRLDEEGLSKVGLVML